MFEPGGIRFVYELAIACIIIGWLTIQVARLIPGLGLMHPCNPNLKTAKGAGGALMLTGLYAMLWELMMVWMFIRLTIFHPELLLGGFVLWCATNPVIIASIFLSIHPAIRRAAKENNGECFLDPLDGYSKRTGPYLGDRYSPVWRDLTAECQKVPPLEGRQQTN
ncbi:MAG: hypothetical protein V1826_02570 [bacterium]